MWVSEIQKNTAVLWEEVCWRGCWEISDFLLWALVIQRWCVHQSLKDYIAISPLTALAWALKLWPPLTQSWVKGLSLLPPKFGKDGNGWWPRGPWKSPGLAEWASLGHMGAGIRGPGNSPFPAHLPQLLWMPKTSQQTLPFTWQLWSQLKRNSLYCQGQPDSWPQF